MLFPVYTSAQKIVEWEQDATNGDEGAGTHGCTVCIMAVSIGCEGGVRAWPGNRDGSAALVVQM